MWPQDFPRAVHRETQRESAVIVRCSYSLLRSAAKWAEKQSTSRNRRESELGEKGWPWDYRNLSISEKSFLCGQTPSARQKRHQTRLLQKFSSKGKITNNIDNIIVGPSTDYRVTGILGCVTTKPGPGIKRISLFYYRTMSGTRWVGRPIDRMWTWLSRERPGCEIYFPEEFRPSHYLVW